MDRDVRDATNIPRNFKPKVKIPLVIDVRDNHMYQTRRGALVRVPRLHACSATTHRGSALQSSAV